METVANHNRTLLKFKKYRFYFREKLQWKRSYCHWWSSRYLSGTTVWVLKLELKIFSLVLSKMLLVFPDPIQHVESCSCGSDYTSEVCEFVELSVKWLKKKTKKKQSHHPVVESVHAKVSLRAFEATVGEQRCSEARR